MPFVFADESEKKPSGYWPDVNIDGMVNVTRLSHEHQRRWWLLFVVVLTISAIIGIFSCVQISEEYFRHSRATSIKIQQLETLLLPKITICAQTPDALYEPRLWRYLNSALPDESQQTKRNLVAFILAGSGFAGLTRQIRTENMTDVLTLNDLYLQLRGEATVKEFYDLFLYNFSYRCQNDWKDGWVFTCKLGGQKPIDGCCTMFEWLDTIHHGRCLSLKPSYQQMADELGKLTLWLFGMPSFFGMTKPGEEKQLDVFTHQNGFIDVQPAPRFRMQSDFFNKLRLKAQKIILLDKCGDNPYGMSTCRQDATLGAHIRRLFKCTLPYWPITYPGYEVCEPSVIFENYEQVFSPNRSQHVSSAQCATPCERWNFEALFESQIAGADQKGYYTGFPDHRLDILFTDLQYEEIREISMVSLFGYVSQIGGQLGLFLGCSIISFLQLGFAGCLCCKRSGAKRIVRRRHRRVSEPQIRSANQETDYGTVSAGGTINVKPTESSF